jgi:hypothetical protein
MITTPNEQHECWRPARPAERPNGRRAQTDIAAGRASALRASQGRGAAARRLRADQRPARPAERPNGRRAQTDSTAGRNSGLRARQARGARARRLRAHKKTPAIATGSAS